tara:strand:- start:1056 stop:2090 length:1035 start_codon:yes stop_codon:yes gene_type:complete
MGLLDNIGKFLSDEETQLNLASGFAGLSGNPNAGNIQQGLQNRLSVLQDDRKLKAANALATTKATSQRNATAAYLRKEGREDLAQAMENGGLTAAQALGQLPKKKDPSAAIQAYEYYVNQLPKGTVPKSFEEYELEQTRAGVAQPEGVGETAWQKAVGPAQVSIFKSYMDKGTAARKTISNTSLLGELGNAMDSGIVPTALRGLVPQGVSAPIDAYKAILTSTALSLKGKGTGPMTDNDFDNLLATAGSISASPAARKIVQLALTENSKIALQIADISSKAISGTMDRLVATQKINELMQANPLTDEMKSQLRAISGDADNGSTMGDIDAADARISALQEKAGN